MSNSNEILWVLGLMCWSCSSVFSTGTLARVYGAGVLPYPVDMKVEALGMEWEEIQFLKPFSLSLKQWHLAT